MNGLSWLLYIAGVAGSLGSFLGFMSFVFLATAAIMLLISLAGNPKSTFSDLTPAAYEFAKKSRFWFLSIGVAFGLVCSATPDKNTVYAIAASEVGEKVVTNPRVMNTTNKAFEALDKWLDKQIDNKPDDADGNKS